MGRLLRWCIFPFGTAYQRPDDALTKKLVASMTQPSSIRDQLTQFCFISKNENELSHRLETALAGADANDALRKKLQVAIKQGDIKNYGTLAERVQAAKKDGILNANETKSMLEYDALINEIIKVNEFTFDLEQVVD